MIKKNIFGLCLVLTLVVVMGASCTSDDTNTNANTAETTVNTITANTNQGVMVNANIVTEVSTLPTVDASTVVASYMKLTLGTIPGASVDYDAATEYMTASLKAEFDADPYFVPSSYCIQDGPDTATVASETVDGETAEVTVEAAWGTDAAKDMWQFDLVTKDGEWKIDTITCL